MESTRSTDPQIVELYRRHRLRLTQLAYRIVGQWNLAEDICSEAFTRLLKNNPEDSAAWLTVVTTRLAYDEAKKSERLRTDYVGLWLPELVAVPADFDQFEEVNIALVRLLQSLSPLDRAVVVLNEVAGYSLREIATALQLTPSAVRQRLVRAQEASGLESYLAGGAEGSRTSCSLVESREP